MTKLPQPFCQSLGPLALTFEPLFSLFGLLA